MNLIEMLNKELIYIADTFDDTDSYYAGFSAFLKEKGEAGDADKIKRLFIKRENIHSTAIGKGAAAPHIYSEEFSRFLFTISLIRNGLDFKSSDKGEVYVVFSIMSDERDVPRHLKSLAHIARMVETTGIIEEIKKAGSKDEIYSILSKYDWNFQ